MANMTVKEIVCLDCGEQGWFEQWDYIDFVEHPDFYELDKFESLWNWKCPHCGKMVMVPHHAVLRDDSHKFIVQFFHYEKRYVPSRYEPQDIPEEFGDCEGYTFRRVYYGGDLLDKVMMLRCELNDVAVERMKHLLRYVLFPNISEAGEPVYFSGIESDSDSDSEYGRICFSYKSPDTLMSHVVSLPVEFYYELAFAVKIDPRMRLNGCKCVDPQWMEVKMSQGIMEDYASGVDLGGESVIRPFVKGFDIIEIGGRRNLMREDGSLVLDDWYHDIYDFVDDSFIVGITQPRTATSPTRYLRGVAHVSGIVLFPAIFDAVQRMSDDQDSFHVELGDSCYVVDDLGSSRDFQLRHLPKRVVVDINALEDASSIDGFIDAEDNFPYNGIVGHVCDGCAYAKAIEGNGNGCGRLFIKAFRDRYAGGYCEYRTPDFSTPSRDEVEKKSLQAIEKYDVDRYSDVFALRLLSEFVADKLDGDINNLRDFDLSTLDDKMYGNADLSRSSIVKAIMSLAFVDAWPGLSVGSIDDGTYWCGRINKYQQLLGFNMYNEYFKDLQRFSPPAALVKRAMNVARLTNSIGNIWVLPHRVSFGAYKDSDLFHGYADRFLKAMYDVFIDADDVDLRLAGIFYKNRKLMSDYEEGVNGFNRFVREMTLEEYVDERGMPKDIFPFVWGAMKDLDRKTYFGAVEAFCEFCEKNIIARADRIIDRLCFYHS